MIILSVIIGSINTNQIIIFCIMAASLHASIDLICVGYFVKTYRLFFILLIKKWSKVLKNLIGIKDDENYVAPQKGMYSSGSMEMRKASVFAIK